MVPPPVSCPKSGHGKENNEQKEKEMSNHELNELLAYHRKQAELNRGKAVRANERAAFHEATIRALTEDVRHV